MAEAATDQSKRILILESDPDAKQSIVAALRESGYGEDNGYEIAMLSDIELGKTAIERDRNFAIVISAWKNPGAMGGHNAIRGTDLLRLMREHKDAEFRTLPFIIHSIDPRAERELVGLGHCAYVNKMETHRNLGRAVKDLLTQATKH